MKSFLSALLRKYQQAQVVDDIPASNHSLQDYFVRANYRPRLTPAYFDDFVPGTGHKVYQPDVYSLAECLASLGARRIIDVGCGKGEKLQSLLERFQVVGIDCGANIDYCQRTYAFGQWITHDLEADSTFPFASSDLQDSIIICSDVIEHLVNPLALLRSLKKCVDYGACVLLSTPERELVRGISDQGPPANPAHIREWTLGELRSLLLHLGFHIPFLGLTANNNVDRQMSTILAILLRCKPHEA